MDFSAFKIPKIANKRKDGGLPPKVQEYTDLKYRKAKAEKNKVESILSKFTVATDKFASIGLATLAFVHFVSPTDKNQIFLGLVDNKDGKYLKARKNKDKGKSFKSDALEVALNAAGIIDMNALGKSQFINMTSVAKGVEIDGIQVIEVFQLSKGEAKPKREKVIEPVADTVADTAAISPAPAVASQPEIDVAPAAKSDWD